MISSTLKIFTSLGVLGSYIVEWPQFFWQNFLGPSSFNYPFFNSLREKPGFGGNTSFYFLTYLGKELPWN